MGKTFADAHQEIGGQMLALAAGVMLELRTEVAGDNGKREVRPLLVIVETEVKAETKRRIVVIARVKELARHSTAPVVVELVGE